jgi:hypothetical protein
VAEKGAVNSRDGKAIYDNLNEISVDIGEGVPGVVGVLRPK